MYRPKAYVMDDVAVLQECIRLRPFATIGVGVDRGFAFAYAPVMMDPEPGPLGRLRFHLARVNPAAGMAGMAGHHVHFSFLGPHAYISPDWYRSSEMVPTWNYVAIEARGCAMALDEGGLRFLLDDLSAAEEAKLAPKPPWKPGKLSTARMTALLGAISGFEVVLEELQGKFKLSQDKSLADFEGSIAGLEARGDAMSQLVAREMRDTRERQS